MKLKNLLFIMLFALGSFNSFAQFIPTCNDVGNMIRTGTTSDFTTTTAQSYYWTVTGAATIDGSRTSKNLNITCTGDYTVRLVRFTGGNCISYCQSFTCSTTPPSCPTDADIFINLGQDAGGLCSDFQVGIPSHFDIDHIDWDWAISGFSGTHTSFGTTTPLHNIPAGNYTNFYVVVGAVVTLSDGTVCDRIWSRKLLDCGNGPGIPIGRKSILSPNPSNGLFSIYNIEGHDVQNVQITTATGDVVKKVSSNFDQKIDLSDQKDGLYFVTISFKDGSKDVEKLIIKN